MLAPPSTASKPCKYGHASGRNKRGKCQECVRAYDAVFRQKNPGYQTNYMRGYRVDKPEKALLFAATERARRDGYACTITEKDIFIPEFCPLLRIKLERGAGQGGVQASSPTLDKIIPELGYSPGNVWVISHRANTLKNNASLEELRTLVNNLTEAVRTFPWERAKC